METPKKQIRLDSSILEQVSNENGILTARVRFAKCGVFPYTYSDGRVVMEAKLPEELYKQTVIDSANGSFVTDDHPIGLVNSDNFRNLIKGTVSKVQIKDGYLEGTEKIIDPILISKIANGEQVQVSIGFTQTTDWTEGFYEGVHYDCIQRNIQINHVAHVDEARAGNDIRIMLDSKDADFAISEKFNQELIAMNKKTLTKRIDGKDFQIDAEIMDYISNLESKKDSIKNDMSDVPKVEPKKDEEMTPEMATEMPAMTAVDIATKLKNAEMAMAIIKEKFGFNSIDELVSTFEAMKSMNDALTKKITDTPPAENIDAMVEDSLLAIRNADNLNIKLDSLKAFDVKKEIIKKVLPSYDVTKLDSKNIGLVYSTVLEVSKTNSINEKNTELVKHDSAIDSELNRAKQEYFNRGKK